MALGACGGDAIGVFRGIIPMTEGFAGDIIMARAFPVFHVRNHHLGAAGASGASVAAGEAASVAAPQAAKTAPATMVRPSNEHFLQIHFSILLCENETKYQSDIFLLFCLLWVE